MKFHQPKSKLMDYFETLEDHFLENPPASVAQALADIFRLTGIGRSLTQCAPFKKVFESSALEVGAIPSKADAQKQEEFLEKELQPCLEEAKAGKRAVCFVILLTFASRLFWACCGVSCGYSYQRRRAGIAIMYTKRGQDWHISP